MSLLPPCDQEIFQRGTHVLTIHGPRAHTIETWIQRIRRETGHLVDWRFVAGRAVVKALGTSEELANLRDVLRVRVESLVADYLKCNNNFTTDPQRDDVLVFWPTP